MVWDAIALVSSGITLVAFMVAAGAWVYKAKIDRTERLIQSALLKQRGPLVDRALESLRINATKLTQEQQYQIALRQLEQRATQYRITAGVVVTIAIFGLVAAIYSINRVDLSQHTSWPEKFDGVDSAQLLVSEVDDALEISVNDEPLKKVAVGEALEPLDIKPLLRRGANKLEFIVYNGEYGGCGSRAQVLLNGIENPAFDWKWEVVRKDACKFCNCATSVKTLFLP
jgi:hypothetical protein